MRQTYQPTFDDHRMTSELDIVLSVYLSIFHLSVAITQSLLCLYVVRIGVCLMRHWDDLESSVGEPLNFQGLFHTLLCIGRTLAGSMM